MSEILDTLRAMERIQFALLMLFLTSYTLCLGSLLEAGGRRGAAFVALITAGGFVRFTDPWYHGLLLLVAMVGIVGLFALAAWVISFAVTRSSAAVVLAAEADQVAAAASRDEEEASGIKRDVGASVAPG